MNYSRYNKGPRQRKLRNQQELLKYLLKTGHKQSPPYPIESFVDESSIQEMEKKQPLGFGKPEDVANAVLFLLNPESRFITGSNLVADGGYTAM